MFLEVSTVGTGKKTFVVVCGVMLAASVGFAAAQDANDLPTEMDKVSYIIGMQVGTKVLQDLKSQSIDFRIEAMIRGLRDALTEKSNVFSVEQQQQIMEAWKKKQVAKLLAQKQQEEAEAMKKLGEDNAWKLKLTKPEMMKFDPNTDYFWVLETNKGEIRVRLMPDVAPMHVTSTIFLTNKGFYDGLTFHRVIAGFMAQGGCPLGTGSGGPGYSYGSEIDPKVKHDRPFLLSMANTGQPNSDGSQFFITFAPTPWLDGKHTIFGEVVAGQDTVKKLEAAAGPGNTGAPTKEPLIINKARIEEKPKG
jgi:peptidyl-prolyl cis-trans isomerase B (cyclophilin B)